MRIQYKSKLLLALSICTVVFIVGCVDTSVQPIPVSIDYSSQIKVVNLVQDAGTATLTLNGQPLGTADFGSEVPGSQTSFLTVPAGNKTLVANFSSAASQSYKFSALTDYKLRVFLVGDSDLVAQTQRYIWQTKDSEDGKTLFPEGIGQVAFLNGSPDAVISEITMTGPDTTVVVTESLALGKSIPYIKLKAGDYSFDVLYNDSLHTTFNYTLGARGRYTAAIYDAAASIKNAVFVDD